MGCVVVVSVLVVLVVLVVVVGVWGVPVASASSAIRSWAGPMNDSEAAATWPTATSAGPGRKRSSRGDWVR